MASKMVLEALTSSQVIFRYPRAAATARTGVGRPPCYHSEGCPIKQGISSCESATAAIKWSGIAAHAGVELMSGRVVVIVVDCRRSIRGRARCSSSASTCRMVPAGHPDDRTLWGRWDGGRTSPRTGARSSLHGGGESRWGLGREQVPCHRILAASWAGWDRWMIRIRRSAGCRSAARPAAIMTASPVFRLTPEPHTSSQDAGTCRRIHGWLTNDGWLFSRPVPSLRGAVSTRRWGKGAMVETTRQWWLSDRSPGFAGAMQPHRRTATISNGYDMICLPLRQRVDAVPAGAAAFSGAEDGGRMLQRARPSARTATPLRIRSWDLPASGARTRRPRITSIVSFVRSVRRRALYQLGATCSSSPRRGCASPSSCTTHRGQAIRQTAEQRGQKLERRAGRPCPGDAAAVQPACKCSCGGVFPRNRVDRL
jgi:hypothetical protein